MPNIYLQMPQYACAYYRNRDKKHILPPDKPVVFPDFCDEMMILRTGLRYLPETRQARAHCFSQFAWRNMLRGRSPGGGKRIINRDADEWLTPAEIITLSGEKVSLNDEVNDYLCIQMPREIVVGGEVHKTNATYTLDGKSALQLRNMLRSEFKNTFQDWLIQDRRYCNHLGIARTRIESIERFLMEFDIPVSADQRERESLRRMVNRWLDKSATLVNDRLRFKDGFFRHLTDTELSQLIEHEKRGTKRF